MARSQRVPARRRGDHPHLLRQLAGRRKQGRDLELPRHRAVRPRGDLGGLAGGLPADAGLRLVEPARRVRERDAVHAGPRSRPRGPARRPEHLMPTAEVLRLDRTYDAPAEAVFDAWTSETVLRRWFHAGADWETSEAFVDLQVGGAVRVVMHDPHEDKSHGGGGRYTEVDRPRRGGLTRVPGREE